MTDLQVAIGSAQMDRAEDIVSERQLLAKKYDQAFTELDWLWTPFKHLIMITDTRATHAYLCLTKFQFHQLSKLMLREMHGWMIFKSWYFDSSCNPCRSHAQFLQTEISPHAGRFSPMHMRQINVAFPSHFFME